MHCKGIFYTIITTVPAIQNELNPSNNFYFFRHITLDDSLYAVQEYFL